MSPTGRGGGVLALAAPPPAMRMVDGPLSHRGGQGHPPRASSLRSLRPLSGYWRCGVCALQSGCIRRGDRSPHRSSSAPARGRSGALRRARPTEMVCVCCGDHPWRAAASPCRSWPLAMGTSSVAAAGSDKTPLHARGVRWLGKRAYVENGRLRTARFGNRGYIFVLGGVPWTWALLRNLSSWPHGMPSPGPNRNTRAPVVARSAFCDEAISVHARGEVASSACGRRLPGSYPVRFAPADVPGCADGPAGHALIAHTRH